MIEKFLSFTRLKQMTYLFVLELIFLCVVALIGNANATFGTLLISFIYFPIEILPASVIPKFLNPCLGLGCIFPNMKLISYVYLFIIGTGTLYVVANSARLLLEKLVKSAKID